MRKSFFIVIGIISFLFNAHYAYAGFGITPPYLRSDTLTKGSVYTQEIIIVRSDPVEDLNAKITINVPTVGGWISVDKGKEFLLPKGRTQFPIKLTVKVPEDAEYGAYTGNIRIMTTSLETIESGVRIALGAQVDVDLEVVDKIYDFEVTRVELSEAETGYKYWWLDFPGKISFWMHIKNTGNVPAAPSRVTFDIYNNAGTKLLESVENTGKVEEVEPFATKKVSANLPTWLPPGGYLVKFKVHKQDEVARAGELTLSVLPKGTVPGYSGYGFEGLRMEDKLSIILPAGAPIAIFGSFRAVKIGKKRKKRKSSGGGKEPPAQQSAPARTVATSHIVDLSRRK
ncbi:MAG: hypothetical protein WCT49_05215 [Candidatus Paceibacterota bacterium]|nr:hypothetical protein [Candidatus Paceibacterota bacterium]